MAQPAAPRRQPPRKTRRDRNDASLTSKVTSPTLLLALLAFYTASWTLFAIDRSTAVGTSSAAVHAYTTSLQKLPSRHGVFGTTRSGLAQPQHARRQPQEWHPATACLRSTRSSPAISMRQLDSNDFKISVGRAMDTLRRDYPKILTRSPDFSIYDSRLETIDPSGVKLHGLSNYKQAFRLLHAIVRLFYCPERSSLSMRMCFDEARQNLRISWNAEVIPKAIFGGTKTTLHVDGISVYEFSPITGNITQHRVERLIINDSMVMPEKGVISALRGYAVRKKVDSIPIFNSHASIDMNFDGILRARSVDHKDRINDNSRHLYSGRIHNEEQYSFRRDGNDNDNDVAGDISMALPFQNFQPVSRQHGLSGRRQSLFAPTDMYASSSSASATNGNEGNNNGNDAFNWEEFERRNKYRLKYNLKPLTPDEFADLQKQVSELAIQQQQRAKEIEERKRQQAMAAASAAKNSFFKQLSSLFEDTCESNFDCERPMICCDFGVKKMCCSSGISVGPMSREGQWAEVPVIARPDNYPPQDGSRY